MKNAVSYMRDVTVPESIVPIIVWSFSTSKKAATTCSPQMKLSITDWERLKRWSSVGLFCQKRDWCLSAKPMSSGQESSLCSITRSNSFIIELIRLIGLQLVVRDGVCHVSVTYEGQLISMQLGCSLFVWRRKRPCKVKEQWSTGA